MKCRSQPTNDGSIAGWPVLPTTVLGLQNCHRQYRPMKATCLSSIGILLTSAPRKSVIWDLWYKSVCIVFSSIHDFKTFCDFCVFCRKPWQSSFTKFQCIWQYPLQKNKKETLWVTKMYQRCWRLSKQSLNPMKGIFIDSSNIFLWHESEHINKKAYFWNFSWFQC